MGHALPSLTGPAMTADPSPRGAAPPADGPLAGRDTPPRNAMPLRGTTESLAALYDVALLDLDGVVYLGGSPIPGAADGGGAPDPACDLAASVARTPRSASV